MSSEHEAEYVEYRMDGDTDIERLHNRLNPPGALGLAAQHFGGTSGPYYSTEEGYGRYSNEAMGDPAVIAHVLSVDTEAATSALRLLDSTEAFDDHPPLEVDFLNLSVSEEDFALNTIKALKTIYDWSKVTARNILSDMTNYELVARYLEFHAENLKVTSKGRGRTLAGNEPLLIKTRIASLSVRYAPVKDITNLLTALRVLTNTVKDYYGYNNDELLKVADRLPGLTGDAEVMAQALSLVSPAKLMQSNTFRPAQNGADQYVSPHLLGCHRVSLKVQESSGALDRRYTVRLVPSDTAPRPLPANIEFKRFHQTTMDQCLNLIADLARYMQSVNTPAIRQRRLGRLDRLAVLTQRLTREVQSGKYDQKNHSKVIGLINQYNDWINNPYKELYGLACRDLRAVLNVCEINSQ